MREMTREQWLGFVLQGTRTGKLGVTRASGQPHVTPVWFLVDETPDGDEVVFTTGDSSVKAKAMGRDPRFVLCVDDQQPPYTYVLLEAEARLVGVGPGFSGSESARSGDLGELLPWATRLGGRYMGEDRAHEFGLRNAVPGELLVRGRITKVTALAEIAD